MWTCFQRPISDVHGRKILVKDVISPSVDGPIGRVLHVHLLLKFICPWTSLADVFSTSISRRPWTKDIGQRRHFSVHGRGRWTCFVRPLFTVTCLSMDDQRGRVFTVHFATSMDKKITVKDVISPSMDGAVGRVLYVHFSPLLVCPWTIREDVFLLSTLLRPWTENIS